MGGRAWLLLGGRTWLLLGGHAWLLLGGMACAVTPGGCAWLLQGGMHGCSQGGHAWLLRGRNVHGIWRDMEIRSMSGQYASYWNAFLFDFRTFMSFLPSANKVYEGYVFTRVCHSVNRWGVSRPIPMGRLRGLAGGSPGLYPRGWGVWPGGFSRPIPRGRLRGLARGPQAQAQAWGVLQAQAQGGVSQHALRQNPPADGYCCRRYASYWSEFLY